MWGTGGTPKSRAADALRQCEDDANVVVAVAVRVCWGSGKIEKARAWIKRAVEKQPEVGDTWAWAAKFERENGGEEMFRKVVEECVKADPKKGRIWTELAMDPDNKTLTTEQLLLKTMEKLPDIEELGRNASEMAARMQIK